jgi:HD-GYP domain-containing protein (c-di-GMP phosphodiesterase class II)
MRRGESGRAAQAAATIEGMEMNLSYLPDLPGRRIAGRWPGPEGDASDWMPFRAIISAALMSFRRINGDPARGTNREVIEEIVAHSRRTAAYARCLTSTLSEQPKLAREVLAMAALFHDVGKTAVPARLLARRGRLSRQEFSLVKMHSALAASMIEAARPAGMSGYLVRLFTGVAMCHHERWDGRGYPFGLSKTQIPFGARLAAIADSYDAVVAKRVYRPAGTHADAVRVIEAGRGTQFDPMLVDRFHSVAHDFAAWATRHGPAHSAAGTSLS